MPNHTPHDLVAAVGAALRAESGHAVAAAIPAQDTAFVAAAIEHRVVGLIAKQGQTIGVSPQVSRMLTQMNMRIAMVSLGLTDTTTRCVSVMREAGIDVLVLKGVALSMQTTGTLNARDTRDIDLLVAPRDVPRAHVALLESGATYPHPMYPGNNSAWRFARWAIRELPYPFRDTEVDLHWRVADEHRVFPDTEVLLGRSHTVSVGDTRLPTLALDDALTAACMYAYTDHYRTLRYLVDIHRLLGLGARVPAETGAGLRQVVADTVGFASELIPGWPVQSLPAHPDTRLAWRLWEQRDDPQGRRRAYAAVFQNAWRYTPQPVSPTVRLLSILTLYPQWVDPQEGARGFARAIRAKMRRLPQAGQGVGA